MIVTGFSIRNGLLATVAVLALAGIEPSSANESRSSLYVSLDTGANFASGLDFQGGDNDRSSICDEYINPQYASVAGCTGPRPGDSWQGSFGSAGGVLAGATLGYRFNDRFRVEANYVFRGSKYDETAPLQSVSGETFAKVSGEIRVAESRLGSFHLHGLFVSALYDFRADNRWTPYFGLGVGVASARADWSAVWARSSDPADITTGTGLSNAAEIQRNLAGRTSFTNATLKDTMFAYQFLAGVDYALSDAVSLEFKVRWTDFGSFEDGKVWEAVRSHPPHLRRDGSEPVAYREKTDDLAMLGISIGLRYALPW